MPTLRRTLLLSAVSCLVTYPLAAQQNTASDRLLRAKALYYTPTTSGLKSFDCKVSFDWKDYLTRFSGQTITDDNPALVYLNATHLSVTDNLTGQGMLIWINTENVPEGKEASFQQIRDGMVQMFGGYLQSWNAYMNGSMVPAADSSIAITPHGDGFQLRTLAGKMDVTEIFDKNSTLSEARVVTENMDVQAFPTYIQSPDGLIIQKVRSLVKQPPTAPPTEVTFTTAYAPVSSFQLPSSVDYDIKNVGNFHFVLSSCEVTTSKTGPAKP